MGQFKLKFEIGEIEFEAEGTYEEVVSERKVFVEQILPLVAKINVEKHEEVEVKDEIKAIEKQVIITPTIVEEKEVAEVKPVTKKNSSKEKSKI